MLGAPKLKSILLRKVYQAEVAAKEVPPTSPLCLMATYMHIALMSLHKAFHLNKSMVEGFTDLSNTWTTEI